MQSFADYKKQQILKSGSRVNVREGVDSLFDVLRVDLTKSVKLPNLSESRILNSIRSEVEFGRFAEDDWTLQKEVIAEFMSVCKSEFYDELLSEVDASDPADFGGDVKEKMNSMFADLKRAIITSLRSSRSTSSAPEKSVNGAPTQGPSAGPTPAGPSQATPQPAAAPQNGGGYGVADDEDIPQFEPSSSPQQHQQAAPAASNQRAPWYKPPGGFGAGLWRVVSKPFKSAWDGVKKAWYDESVIYEHMLLLEDVFAEIEDKILATIDAFQDDLMKFVMAKLPQVAQDSGNPAAPQVDPVVSNDPVAAKAADPAAIAPNGLPATAVPGSTTVDVDQERSVAPATAAGPATLPTRFGGARALGIAINTKNWAKTKPADFVFPDGESPSGWGEARDKTLRMIYGKINELDPHAILVGRSSKSSRREAVMKILGLTDLSGTKTAVHDILRAFDAKFGEGAGKSVASAESPPAAAKPELVRQGEDPVDPASQVAPPEAKPELVRQGEVAPAPKPATVDVDQEEDNTWPDEGSKWFAQYSRKYPAEAKEYLKYNSPEEASGKMQKIINKAKAAGRAMDDSFAEEVRAKMLEAIARQQQQNGGTPEPAAAAAAPEAQADVNRAAPPAANEPEDTPENIQAEFIRMVKNANGGKTLNGLSPEELNSLVTQHPDKTDPYDLFNDVIGPAILKKNGNISLDNDYKIQAAAEEDSALFGDDDIKASADSPVASSPQEDQRNIPEPINALVDRIGSIIDDNFESEQLINRKYDELQSAQDSALKLFRSGKEKEALELLQKFKQALVDELDSEEAVKTTRSHERPDATMGELPQYALNPAESFDQMYNRLLSDLKEDRAEVDSCVSKIRKVLLS